MRQIFWGMLFLFLDFNLNLGSSSIGLIPDFVGCIFLIRGLDALAGESVRFVQARPWAVATAAYTGITWTLDLLGIHLGIFSLVLGLGNLALCVYLSWLIVQGILQTEQSKGCSLGGQTLRQAWLAAVIAAALSYPLAFIPVLNWLCILAGLGCTIWFLSALYRCRKLYEENGNQIHISL